MFGMGNLTLPCLRKINQPKVKVEDQYDFEQTTKDISVCSWGLGTAARVFSIFIFEAIGTLGPLLPAKQ